MRLRRPIRGGGFLAQTAKAQTVTLSDDSTTATITTTEANTIGKYKHENYQHAYVFTDAITKTIDATASETCVNFKVVGPICDDDVNAILTNNNKKNVVTLDLSEATIDSITPVYQLDDAYFFKGTFGVCKAGYNTLKYLSFPQLSANATSTVIPTHIFNDANYTVVSNLTSLVIPGGYTKIEEKAFNQSMKLETLDLSRSSITEICASAFTNCNSLESIKFPKTLETIGENAFNFSGGTKLTSLDLSGTSVKTIGKAAFWKCTSLTNLVFPETLERVEDEAFEQHACKVLLFPQNVKYLGSSAFISVANDLSDVYFQGLTSPECAEGVFSEGAYNGWGGNSGGNLDKLKVATRENYVNGSHWFTILHFRPDLTDEQRATYWDSTRVYTIPDAYLGNERMWPNQTEYTKGHDNIYKNKQNFIGDSLTVEQQKHIGILRFILARADAPIPDQNIPITDNNWWTICLPYSLSKAEVKKYFGENTLVYTLGQVVRNYDNHTIKLLFTSDQMEEDDLDPMPNAGGIQAWNPYVIKPSKDLTGENDYDELNGFFKNVIKTRLPEAGSEQNIEIPATATGTSNDKYWGYVFRGSCSGVKTKTSNVNPLGVQFHRPSTCYFLGGKKDANGDYKVSFFYQNGVTNKAWAPYTCVVLPCNYKSSDYSDGTYKDDSFTIDGEQKVHENTTCFGFDDDATAIDQIVIVTPDKAVNGNIYNLAGQLVRSNATTTDGLPAGIYVSGGKKFVVK